MRERTNASQSGTLSAGGTPVPQRLGRWQKLIIARHVVRQALYTRHLSRQASDDVASNINRPYQRLTASPRHTAASLVF
jgi:hypothetical protein